MGLSSGKGSVKTTPGLAQAAFKKLTEPETKNLEMKQVNPSRAGTVGNTPVDTTKWQFVEQTTPVNKGF